MPPATSTPHCAGHGFRTRINWDAAIVVVVRAAPRAVALSSSRT
ncbi:MAG: hypothetical protein ACRD0L_12630 [Acidimicrobiales bacterium]